MSLRVCVLASGSSGNCTLIQSNTTSILVDAGLSGKQTKARLEQIGVKIQKLDAICLSHEHDDHANGVRILHHRYNIPLYANSGTVDALRHKPKHKHLPWTIFTTGSNFVIGNLTLHPFGVPHDAYEPVGFVVSSEGCSFGIAMDLGVPTNLVRERLRGCQVLLVEANHDESLLQEASRPWNLKQRIRGRQGHLSNRVAANMVADIAGPNMHHVFLGHLSEDCNREDLAVTTMRQALDEKGQNHVKIGCTYPDRVSAWWTDRQQEQQELECSTGSGFMYN